MLPQEFLQRMEALLGAEYPDFLAGYEGERFQALRVNTLKRNESGESPRETLSALFELEQVPWEENGFYYTAADQPGKHALHEAGAYYIQEPSAMAPAVFLDALPGERVLDLCAAPGGKSTQIADRLQGRGLLLANEIHSARAKILSENIERMGVRNACVTNETPEHLREVFPEFFDKILVDAPCSGEGMFRKNEEACAQWSTENVLLCGQRQDAILDCAAEMLRPGGRLVYSTCTFAPVENEECIRRFLKRHPEFHALPKALERSGTEQMRRDADAPGTLRLYPHRLKGEGHFLAVLQKEGSVPEGYAPVARSGRADYLGEKDLALWHAFCREQLSLEWKKAQYIKFGEQLYLAPEYLPGLKGLKVLRPGLHIGTLKKDRFEPSHALALALSAQEVMHVWRLGSSERTVGDYLKGQTFPAQGKKGWYLILADGFSIGWGKLSGDVMKNHYPKGLRKG